MSQYHVHLDSNAEYAGCEAFAPQLAPCLPTMDQSGGWNAPAHAGLGQPVGSKAALPPDVESVSLHAKAGFTGCAGRKRGSAAHDRKISHIPNVCNACSTSFSNNYRLERHATKTKHKAYLCSCGKAFTKLSALRRHVEESTQAREHQCPVCGNEFKRPGHVDQHLRLIHQMPKDAIKDLIRAQKSQPRQKSDQASAASALIPAGPANAQVNPPVVIPDGSWTGPIDFSAPAPAEHPGSRPGNFSALFSRLPTSGSGFVPEIPAFTPQSFMPQAADPAYQNSAAANQTGLSANAAPDFVGYLATYPAGDLGSFNVDPATMPVNSVGAFGAPTLENDFLGELIDFDFDFDFNVFNL